jgi:hypothetical protein
VLAKGKTFKGRGMTNSTQEFKKLAHEHRLLLQEYGRVQTRCTELITAQAAEIRRLQAELMKMRAAVIVRDTALAYAREEHATMEATIPGLPKRTALAQQVKNLTSRIEWMLRERVQKHAAPASQSVPVDLQHKSVLCIGHPTTELSATRQMIERAGGRFLHYDDVDHAEQNDMLEASLVAADLVICQTGCVSHNAYWRVQDHCMRTGKQCVLIDQPQALHFVRNVQQAWASTEDEASR